ncbi:glycosyltransferase involved in cell wall biosynthesis [Nakamurella sp. UYEF19]
MASLSIVMPVFNEGRTIRSAIERVLAVDYPCPVELIVVDDGSNDATGQILETFDKRGLILIRHRRNQGKGAAVCTGVERATGTHLIVLDADLEYSPNDISAMLAPVIEGKSDHVFGTRVFGMNTRFTSFRFAMGGRMTTLAANLLFDSCLTDMHTCLKLLPVDDFRALRLSEDGFGLDTELTARLLRAGIRPYEVPISYNGRSMVEGKKISWKDGVRCLQILVRVRSERHPQALPSAVVITAHPMPVPDAKVDVVHRVSAPVEQKPLLVEHPVAALHGGLPEAAADEVRPVASVPVAI